MTNPARDDGGLSQLFWQKVDERIDARAMAMIDAALTNLRPGGAHPLLVEVASPAAGTASPVLKVPILYPCAITQVDLYAKPGDVATVTVDFHVARPGQTLASGTSICGTAKPTLTASDRGSAVPDASWAGYRGGAAYLEVGSVLMFYVDSASGATSLTISANVRAF